MQFELNLKRYNKRKFLIKIPNMMIRYLILLFIFTLSLYAQIDKDELDKLNVEALLIKELTTGEVIYSKEALKEVKPASLTKIMTAILAIEQQDLMTPVIITKEMIQVEPTKAGYKEGEIILLGDLIKAAMIKSDNDAAMAVAIAVGGNMAHFVEMMNQKAELIGMNDTHFTNPCGFDIEIGRASCRERV